LKPIQLLLIRHAPTAATVRGTFPDDEPLRDGLGPTGDSLRILTRGVRHLLSGPESRALETARALGLDPVIDELLADCNYGSWAGKGLTDIHASDPEGVLRWFRDCDANPHGGESLSDLARRVGGFLKRAAKLDGLAVAVTHAAVIRVAVLLALRAPIEAFWQVEVAPTSVTELRHRNGKWVLQSLNLGGRSAQRMSQAVS
jgi:broad specificity phosphatase PhoE